METPGRRQQVRVNGMRRFQRALGSVKDKVGAVVTDVVSLMVDIDRDEEDREEALQKKMVRLTESVDEEL